MSLWEFAAAFGGYIKANSPPDEQGLTSEQAASLAASLEEPAVWH